MIHRRVILIAAVVLMLGAATVAFAQQQRADLTPMTFRPNVPIGSFSGDITVDADLLPRYISAFYTYFLSVVGIIAVVMIMYGGFRWITASGNPSRIGAAKEIIQSAIIGLILALTSRLILQTINPELVSLRLAPIQQIEQILQLGANCSETEEGRRAVGSIECGKPVSYTDRDGRLATCISHQCEVASNVCAYDQERSEYACMFPDAVCGLSSNCSANDQLLASSAAQESGLPLVCRPQFYSSRLPGADNGECTKTVKLGCQPNETKVSCDTGIQNQTDPSPCWDANGPRKVTISGPGRDIAATCTSSSRAGVNTDAVCCAVNKTKASIYCRPTPVPGGQYVQVNCGSYNPLPGTYAGSGTPSCEGDNHCYIWLRLRTSNAADP